MRINKLFELFPNSEGRRKFLENLVEDAIVEAGLFFTDQEDVNWITFYAGSGYARNIEIDPKNKIVKLYIPIFRNQYDGDLKGVEGEPATLAIELRACDGHEIEELPMIIRYLTEAGVLTDQSEPMGDDFEG
jgi:hypothetical protein